MNTRPFIVISICSLLVLLSTYACATPPSPTATPAPTEIETLDPSPTETVPVPTDTITATIEKPTATETLPPSPTATETSTPDLRGDPAEWQEWPVVPTVSARAEAIYAQGLAKGNDPAHFSKVGDCQNITTYFLAIFDDPDQYRLGSEYAYLQEAVDHFSGSFSRESLAVSGGMNVASVLSTYWVDDDRCQDGESPLACELRLHQPTIVLISMEESWGSNNKVENYEKYMRQIIEQVIEFGAVPVLATKADNLEGDHQINQAIVRLAHEYDIPLWNFWLAVQPLPNHGLLEDGFHLTHGLNYYDESKNLKQAWPVRNLTALQVLDAVWRQLNDLPGEGE
jgi:hypothetical protein